MSNAVEKCIHKLTRITSFLTSTSIFVYFAIEDNSFEYFIYFTDWGMFLTSVYFLISLLSYWIPIEAVVTSNFLVIWVFNWLITLAFWGYLYPVEGSSDIVRSSITHSVPLLATLIEYLQVKINIARLDYVYPLGVLMGYLFLVLVPYTLAVRPIYTGIDFQSVFSVMFCTALFWIAVVFLEIVSIGKEKKRIGSM